MQSCQMHSVLKHMWIQKHKRPHTIRCPPRQATSHHTIIQTASVTHLLIQRRLQIVQDLGQRPPRAAAASRQPCVHPLECIGDGPRLGAVDKLRSGVVGGRVWAMGV